MKIKGFSYYEIEPDGKLFSTKTGSRKEIGGGKRDNTVRLRADNGNVLVCNRTKILWCVMHNICPFDFPEGDYIVSKEHGIISKSELMHRNNEKIYKTWNRQEAMDELDRCRKDNEMQLLYLYTGNMNPLLLRFEEYKPEIRCILADRYGMNNDTAELIIEHVFDGFIKNVQSNFPIHSIKAYMVGAAKRQMKAYRKEKRNIRSIEEMIHY